MWEGKGQQGGAERWLSTGEEAREKYQGHDAQGNALSGPAGREGFSEHVALRAGVGTGLVPTARGEAGLAGPPPAGLEHPGSSKMGSQRLVLSNGGSFPSTSTFGCWLQACWHPAACSQPSLGFCGASSPWVLAMPAQGESETPLSRGVWEVGSPAAGAGGCGTGQRDGADPTSPAWHVCARAGPAVCIGAAPALLLLEIPALQRPGEPARLRKGGWWWRGGDRAWGG